MITLLKQLERQGVRLALNEKGQLISQSSKEAVTPAIGALIKAHKDELVRCLAARAAFEAPIVAQGVQSGPLSSSQSGLWFIEQYEEASHLYNMPVYFRVRGELDTRALEFAFDHLFARTPACAPVSSRTRRAGGPRRYCRTFPSPCLLKTSASSRKPSARPMWPDEYVRR
ncbi:non-ribosomal peptide synthetase [Aeromonas salmonicida subsp. pectinolytica 34mel]|nr:non-ribosomal peptide synthetase [Aeromonas salmonicida subsp. pectinolytica 34mel]